MSSCEPGRRRRAISVALALALVATTSAATADTRTFSHADKEWLVPGQSEGAAMWVPEGARGALPAVVVLHGVNPTGALHLWMGGEGRDLRPLAARLVGDASVEPFVLLAPSQTRAATRGRTLFDRFDLTQLLADAGEHLPEGTSLDTDRVIVMGHSGAGCNANGGIFAAAAARPMALIAVDTCLEPIFGEALARAQHETWLGVYWANGSSPRDLPGYWRAFRAAAGDRPEASVEGASLELTSEGAHYAVFPRVFESTVVRFLSN